MLTQHGCFLVAGRGGRAGIPAAVSLPRSWPQADLWRTRGRLPLLRPWESCPSSSGMARRDGRAVFLSLCVEWPTCLLLWLSSGGMTFLSLQPFRRERGCCWGGSVSGTGEGLFPKVNNGFGLQSSPSPQGRLNFLT